MPKAKMRKKIKTGRPLLAAALFCEKILEEKDNLMTLVRIFDVINIPKPAEPLTSPEEGEALPKVVAHAMLFLAFKSGDAKGEYEVTVNPVLPSGKRLTQRNAVPMTLLGAGHGVNIRATVFVPTEEEGLLWFEVRANGKLMTRIPLQVVHVTPPSDNELAEPSSALKEKS